MEQKNKEVMEIEREEIENNIKILEKARNKLNNEQKLSEEDLPIENRNEWINHNNQFIEQKLSVLYFLQEEQEQSLNFYEGRLNIYEFEKPSISEDDFNLLPLTKEEEKDLNDRLRLTAEEENYLENENRERYYTNKYGEEY